MVATGQTMRATMMIAAVAAAGLACGGCGSLLPSTKPVNVNTWMEDYYGQKRNTETMIIEGTNVEFSIKGATKIVMAAPVQPISIIPREPGVLDSIGNLFGQVVPWVAGAYIGGKLADRPATVQPAVVEQQVLVPIEGVAAP